MIEYDDVVELKCRCCGDVIEEVRNICDQCLLEEIAEEQAECGYGRF
jgi:hypothetical protein